MYKQFDNITQKLVDDLKQMIQSGNRISVVAACFSMYAYQELKEQLETVDSFRFIFNAPTFVPDAGQKEKREFYIPKLGRESSLYGTEFEIRLRNEMTPIGIRRGSFSVSGESTGSAVKIK